MAVIKRELGIEKSLPLLQEQNVVPTHEDSKRFQCFACKKTGGCFDLVMGLRGRRFG
jgi:hypothetical protein